VVYALILALIPLAPKMLIATKDGEPNPEIEAEVANKTGETAPNLTGQDPAM